MATVWGTSCQQQKEVFALNGDRHHPTTRIQWEQWLHHRTCVSTKDESGVNINFITELMYQPGVVYEW